MAGVKENLYLMPEYVTAFLLARNIKLQFSGVDANSASHLAQLIVGASRSSSVQIPLDSLLMGATDGASASMAGSKTFSGNYQMFTLYSSASLSAGYKKTSQTMTVDRTANGMILNIPGAQIIGYYTTVLPKFPTKQPHN